MEDGMWKSQHLKGPACGRASTWKSRHAESPAHERPSAWNSQHVEDPACGTPSMGKAGHVGRPCAQGWKGPRVAPCQRRTWGSTRGPGQPSRVSYPPQPQSTCSVEGQNRPWAKAGGSDVNNKCQEKDVDNKCHLPTTTTNAKRVLTGSSVLPCDSAAPFPAGRALPLVARPILPLTCSAAVHRQLTLAHEQPLPAWPGTDPAHQASTMLLRVPCTALWLDGTDTLHGFCSLLRGRDGFPASLLTCCLYNSSRLVALTPHKGQQSIR